MPLHPAGALSVISMKLNDESQLETTESTLESVEEHDDYNREIALKIMEAVPRYTWPAVLDACVANIVDELPADTLFRIAELYLTEYYLENSDQIIPDMLRIKGVETTCHILDSLQLEKLPEPARRRAEEEAQQHTDNSPSSIDPN